MKRTFLTAAVIGAPLLVTLFLIGCGKPKGDDEDTWERGEGRRPRRGDEDRGIETADEQAGRHHQRQSDAQGQGAGHRGPERQVSSGHQVQAGSDCDLLSTWRRTRRKRSRIGTSAPATASPTRSSGFSRRRVTTLKSIRPTKPGRTRSNCRNRTARSFRTSIGRCRRSPTRKIPRRWFRAVKSSCVSNTAAVSHNTVWKSEPPVNSGSEGVIPAGTKPKPLSPPLSGAPRTRSGSFQLQHPPVDGRLRLGVRPSVRGRYRQGRQLRNQKRAGRLEGPRIVAWHEKVEYLAPGKKKGEEIELKDGENEKNFDIEIK